MAKDKNRAVHAVTDAEGPRPDVAAAATPAQPVDLSQVAVEVAEVQDRYLRLAAEFDNFRKRTARERTEVWLRAQADLVARLADALDDLSRFAHVNPATTDANAIHDGVALVDRKVWKALDALGVRRLEETGVPFDPNQHEAVSMQPATEPAEDHTVGAVLQPGYRMGDLLIRPARVVVRTWRDGLGPSTEDSAPGTSGV
jgi:molecular chaperone GrpE